MNRHDPSRGTIAPAPVDADRRPALPAGPRAPGAARMVLAQRLCGQAPPGVIDDAQLVVSELIGVIAPRAPDLVSGGGFGLNVVAAPATRWGVTRDGTTRVWAEPTWPADALVGGEVPCP